MIKMETKNKLNELVLKLDRAKMPKHIAIIMDGNGRWAKKNGLPRFFGHNEGIKTVRKMCEICGDLEEIKILTLYAFSTENWKRPSKEIKVLMHLLRSFLQNEIDEMNANNIKLSTIGDIEALPEYIQKKINDAKDATKNNTKFILNLALNYSGRAELLTAVNKMIETGIQNCDEKTLANHLYTKDMPDPDLLIRTSGEMRISNFLLWQIAYSEIWVTSTFWPDFTKEEFVQAIIDFQNRERRFGGV